MALTDAEVREWVGANLEPTKRAFGLEEWETIIEYGANASRSDNSHVKAQVVVLFEYQRATIRFDSAAFGTIDELRRALEHELCHLILGPVNLPFDMVYELLSRKKWKAVEVAFLRAEEIQVRGMERLIARLREGTKNGE